MQVKTPFELTLSNWCDFKMILVRERWQGDIPDDEGLHVLNGDRVIITNHLTYIPYYTKLCTQGFYTSSQIWLSILFIFTKPNVCSSLHFDQTTRIIQVVQSVHKTNLMYKQTLSQKVFVSFSISCNRFPRFSIHLGYIRS